MFDPQLLYHPGQGGPFINAAAAVPNTPITEYYRDHVVTRMYRVRNSVKDIGAFESTTTGPGIGPYDTQPPLDGGVTFPDGGGGGDGGGNGDGGGGGDGGTTGGGSSGCGCDVVGNSSGYGGVMALIGLLAAGRRRTRRAS